MRTGLPIWIVCAVLVSAAARAEQPAATPERAPPPPELPADYNPPAAPAPDPSSIEPEVTITTREGTRYEEYRVNGRLYKVKVIPARGAPYYLIDHDGSGDFRRSDVEPRISIPLWVIKTF